VTVYAQPRESWLERVVDLYGEPRHEMNNQVQIEDEFGPCLSQSWLWFPKGINHCVSIRQYEPRPPLRPKEFWILKVSTHKPYTTRAQIKLASRPTDEQINNTLDICLFFEDAEAIVQEFHDERVLAMTLEVGTM